MSRLIGWLILIIFLLVGTFWAHWYAQHDWTHSSGIVKVGAGAVGTNGDTVNKYSHPLGESRRLYVQAKEFYEADNSEAAIEKIDSSIEAADSIKSNNEEFYKNKENRQEVIDWRALLERDKEKWQDTSAQSPTGAANRIVVDSGKISGSSRSNAIYKTSESSSTASSVIEEDNSTDLVVGKQNSIIGMPPPPLVRNQVSETDAATGTDNNVTLVNAGADKAQMLINGYNSLADGDDYMDTDEFERAEYSYIRAKAWYDALHRKFPEYQSKTVKQRREDLDRKINSIREQL